MLGKGLGAKGLQLVVLAGIFLFDFSVPTRGDALQLGDVVWV